MRGHKDSGLPQERLVQTEAHWIPASSWQEERALDWVSCEPLSSSPHAVPSVVYERMGGGEKLSVQVSLDSVAPPTLPAPHRHLSLTLRHSLHSLPLLRPLEGEQVWVVQMVEAGSSGSSDGGPTTPWNHEHWDYGGQLT